MQGHTTDLSTGRLAAEELDLSTGQLSRGIPVGIGLSSLSGTEREHENVS